MQKSSSTAISSRSKKLGLVTVITMVTAGCGGNDLSLDPLPPIQTTTTTSTTTTLPDTNRYFYEVRSGDTLSAIAAGFGVPMKQIVELNDLENASDIQVGEIIEIPQGFVIVTLPPDSTVASTG